MNDLQKMGDVSALIQAAAYVVRSARCRFWAGFHRVVRMGGDRHVAQSPRRSVCETPGSKQQER
jgi:hypothetical protein